MKVTLFKHKSFEKKAVTFDKDKDNAGNFRSKE